MCGSIYKVFFSPEPPVRIVSPSEPELEMTHLASERLELSCEISQADAPVRWYKDSLEVDEGENLILEEDGAQRRLVIPITTVDDTGEYICDTEDDSVSFLVTITGKHHNKGILNFYSFSIMYDLLIAFNLEPPVMLTRPKNMPDKLESFAGKTIVLESRMSRPNAEVKWWLNGREVEESSNITITQDGLIRRLTIHSPTPEDSGKYTCDAVDDKIDFQVKVSGKAQCQILKSSFKDGCSVLY